MVSGQIPNHLNWPEEPNCEYDQILTVQLDEPLQMEFPDINRFSKLIRLIRTTAWIIFFKEVIKIPKTFRSDKAILGVDEIEKARTLWIRKSQNDTFPDEIVILKKDRCVPKSSRLYKLSVFLDEEHIMRLGGRIPENERLGISFESRSPIILEPKHKFTSLWPFGNRNSCE
ncbi:hypothetical protein JTB14_009772 [Gonioctena quinquepunctata]|nr:hypothetical protein JTB14_009772 [Gonioctena quinquepunctata]